MDPAWIIVLSVLVGLVLLAFEVLTPSFGILTALALAAFGVAIWQAFEISTPMGVGLIIALAVAVPLYYVFLFRCLAKTAFARKLFLKPGENSRGEGTPGLSEFQQLVGKTGTAETQLRPSGAVRIDGRRVPALSESGIIQKGTAVRVLRIDGMSLIVKAADAASSNTASA